MKLFLCLCCCLPACPAFPQMLKGLVSGESNEAVPSASVYIREIRQGLITNRLGEFQTKLPPGVYHLEIRCLGYESQIVGIEQAAQGTECRIVLKNKDLQLPEVQVRTCEDPAYAMMRQAIKKAPYYQYAVQKASYEAYTKGSGKMTDLPAWLNKMSNNALAVYRDKLFLQESFSEFVFTAPDRLEQTVKAYSSTFPNSNDPKSAIAVGMASLYNPVYGGSVSPLHPKALDYYRFRYEGYEEENGQVINKIRIIPKLKDGKLLEGVIYLADDEWSIRSAEIVIRGVGMTTHYFIHYHQVRDDIYLPASMNFSWDISVLGARLKADFLSSLQYTGIQLNDSLIAAQPAKAPAKKKKDKPNLEIKPDDLLKQTADSLALQRDSAYWSDVRTVVLNEEELRSYERKDTIQAYTDSINKAGKNPEFDWTDILTGGKLGNDSSVLYFRYGGLVQAIREYNLVDGWVLGQPFTFDFKKRKLVGWTVSPEFYWAFARKSLVWQTGITLDYAPLRLGKLQFSAGHISDDYSGEVGVSRLGNSLYSAFFGKNQGRLIEKSFIKAGNQIDLANGLQLGAGVELAERNLLENHTNWHLFKNNIQPEPNLPGYAGDLNSGFIRLAAYSVHLKYNPEYYYRIDEGRKRYVRSRFPTIELDYRQGVYDSEFQRLELSLHQELKFEIFNRFRYTVVAGGYLNKNAFNYLDYKHFKTSDMIEFDDDADAYALFPYYRFSTSKYWLQAFADYNTDYLLLKRLPFLQGKMFSESLHAKFLHTPGKPYYSEWGYSIDLSMGLANFGVYVALDALKFNSVNFRLAIPLIEKIGKQGGGLGFF
jgi:hypothetical protein